MVKIESNKTKINKSSNEVYEYLLVPENYRVLMPGKVRSFESTDTSALLDIEGIGKVELAITDTQENSFIEMIPQNKVPFKFNLQWNIAEDGEKQTMVQAVINAELNFMMRMMAEKVLKGFLDIQVEKLKNHLNVE